MIAYLAILVGALVLLLALAVSFSFGWGGWRYWTHRRCQPCSGHGFIVLDDDEATALRRCGDCNGTGIEQGPAS